MNYLKVKDIAAQWNVVPEMVSKLCKDGRIPGAYKNGKSWMIPEGVQKPTNTRRRQERSFKFIDLFCGIGGFHQAMKQLGGECVFACDISLQCRDVYKSNFCPNDEFTVYGDIRKAINNNVIPRFDVLCGGFPCQTFSKAGLQNGFDVVEKDNGEKDERGQLFYRIIDILSEHPECKYIVLENVRNLADKEDNWNVVCTELKKQGFIITEKPIIESPHHFGIPQVRERVFILGIKKDVLDKRRKLPNGFLTRELLNVDAKLNSCPEDGNCLEYILDENVDNSYCVPKEIEELLNIWEEFRENVVGLASPFWIHKAGIGIYERDKYENDPNIGYQDMPEWKKKLVMKSRVMYENNFDFIDDWIKRHNMRARHLIHQKFEWNCGNDCNSIKDGIIQIRQSGVRVKRPNYFPSLVAMKNTPIVWDKQKKHYRYVTPKESAKLQSFDENYIFSDVDAASYRQLGNAVNVELVRMFAEELFKLGK